MSESDVFILWCVFITALLIGFIVGVFGDGIEHTGPCAEDEFNVHLDNGEHECVHVDLLCEYATS